MAKATKKATIKTRKQPAVVVDPRLAQLEQELVALGQQFTGAAKALAEKRGASLFVKIQLVPQLKKEKTNGSI